VETDDHFTVILNPSIVPGPGVYNLLGEMRELMCHTELQNKKSSTKSRAHPIVKQTDTQSRQLIVGIDYILNDIAGPQSDDTRWHKDLWPLLQCNAFKRLLYKAMATFLRKVKVDVEKDYKWLARYTEDIGQDAPSQIPLYFSVIESLRHKKLSAGDMLREHMRFAPYHEDLALDFVEGKDDEHRLRGHTQSSNQSKRQRSPQDTQVQDAGVNRSLDETFGVYDNPVVDPIIPSTPLLSTVNLSALKPNSQSLVLSDLKTPKQK